MRIEFKRRERQLAVFDGRRLGLVGDQLAQERNETEGSET
jgi:hypothetical protein